MKEKNHKMDRQKSSNANYNTAPWYKLAALHFKRWIYLCPYPILLTNNHALAIVGITAICWC